MRDAAFTIVFAVITLLWAGPAAAVAPRSDILEPARQKPPAETVFPTMHIPGTSATLELLGRFHLSRRAGEIAVQAAEPIRAHIGGVGLPIHIRIDETEEPLLTLQTDGGGLTMTYLHVPAALVDLGDTDLVVQDLAARAILGDEPSLRVLSLRVRPVALDVWAPAVDLTATASLRGETLSLEGAASTPDHGVSLAFDGAIETGAGTGKLDVRLNPVSFTLGGLQPHDLVPALGDTLHAVTGRVRATASLRLGAGEPEAHARITLDDVSFSSGDVHAETLNGTVRFASLWPLRTPPGQTLTLARIDPGVPATDGVVRFQIDSAGRLRIETAGIDVSGGRISVDDVVIDPTAERHAFVLRAQGLDLQEALDVADVHAATISGRVSGAIPVTLSADGVAIDDASLSTDQAGELRYAPATPPAALQQDDDRIALLRSALENFHYDRLSVALSGRSGETWRSVVQIAGNNPDLLDGQPIVLNVDLSVVPGEASLDLAGTRLDVGDALPLYNALFGVGFLEWLGDRLSGLAAPDG